MAETEKSQPQPRSRDEFIRDFSELKNKLAAAAGKDEVEHLREQGLSLMGDYEFIKDSLLSDEAGLAAGEEFENFDFEAEAEKALQRTPLESSVPKTETETPKHERPPVPPPPTDKEQLAELRQWAAANNVRGFENMTRQQLTERKQQMTRTAELTNKNNNKKYRLPGDYDPVVTAAVAGEVHRIKGSEHNPDPEKPKEVRDEFVKIIKEKRREVQRANQRLARQEAELSKPKVFDSKEQASEFLNKKFAGRRIESLTTQQQDKLDDRERPSELQIVGYNAKTLDPVIGDGNTKRRKDVIQTVGLPELKTIAQQINLGDVTEQTEADIDALIHERGTRIITEARIMGIPENELKKSSLIHVWSEIKRRRDAIAKGEVATPVAEVREEDILDESAEDRKFFEEEFEKRLEEMLRDGNYPEKFWETQKQIWREMYKDEFVRTALEKLTQQT